jgi:hypothetical protein
VLRQVVTLADDAVTLPAQELRDRLLALANWARLAHHPLAHTAQDSRGSTLCG